MSSSSSPVPGSPTIPSSVSTDASSVSSATTPSHTREPAHTVVTDLEVLKLFLEAVLRHIKLPPTLFSKVLSAPRPLPTTTELAKPSKGGAPSSAFFGVSPSMPQLFIDAEGIGLSRQGELSILIVHLETAEYSHTYLLHVHVLKYAAFNTFSSDGHHSLRTILQDNRIPKVLFDCRMDSDALFGQYGVLLCGVIDLQLMCLASRYGGGQRLPGLESCLLNDLNISSEEQERVAQAKSRGQQLWHPKHGGSTERFNDYPLHPIIVQYCVVDTAYLPQLFKTYNSAIGGRVSLSVVDRLWGKESRRELAPGVYSWECSILAESKRRVERALDPGFTGGSSYNPWYFHDPYEDYY